MRRLSFVALLFSAALLAACSGFGSTNLFPSEGSAQMTLSGTLGGERREIVVRAPVSALQALGRHAQAIGVATVSAFASQSPAPASLQIVALSSPGPCTVTAESYTCALAVQASPGADAFYVDAFSDASPAPGETPFASFVSSPIVVASTPAPGASPLPLAIGSSIASVAVTVPSPAAAGTNLQLFTAGTPSSWQPLIVTALDANGAAVLFAPGATLASAIPIAVSPANQGVGLALASQCGGASSTSAHPVASVTITCAADLTQVQFGYTGSVAYDQYSHIVDTFSLAATQAASPAPSPAIVGLQSALATATPLPGFDVSTVLFARTKTALAFLAGSGSSWRVGTLDPVTLTATSHAYAQHGTPRAFAVSANGTLWVVESGALDCYSSVSSASGAPVQIALAGNNDSLGATDLAIDGTGALWFTGTNSAAGTHAPTYAGTIPAANACGASRTVTARVRLENDHGDDAPSIAPLPLGGVAIGSSSITTSSGIYIVAAGSRSPIKPTLAALTGASNTRSAGIAADAAGNVYASFVVPGSDADIESAISGSGLTTLLAVPPTNTAEGAPAPFGMTSFAPSSAIDRLLTADATTGAVDLIENVPSSPMPVLVVPAPGASIGAVAYGPQGDAYAAYTTASQSLGVAHLLATTYWSIPNGTIGSACASAGIVGILERGDSGPFTIAFPNGGGSAAPFAGTTHDFWITLTNPNVPALVTDAHGRTQSVTFSDAYTGASCAKPDSSPRSEKQAS